MQCSWRNLTCSSSHNLPLLSQSGVDQVIVEQMEATSPVPPAKLTLDMQILGLDTSKGLLLAYDGKQASVYEVKHCIGN